MSLALYSKNMWVKAGQAEPLAGGSTNMAEKGRFETILTEKKDGMLWISLNRPHRMNACNMDLIDEMTTIIEEAEVTYNQLNQIIITNSHFHEFGQLANTHDITFNINETETQTITLGVLDNEYTVVTHNTKTGNQEQLLQFERITAQGQKITEEITDETLDQEYDQAGRLLRSNLVIHEHDPESDDFEVDEDDELADLSDILDDVEDDTEETAGDTLELHSLPEAETNDSESELDLASVDRDNSLDLNLSLEDDESEEERKADSAEGSVTPLPEISELDLTLEGDDEE